MSLQPFDAGRHVEHDASDLCIARLHVARADAMILCVRRKIARVYVRKYKHECIYACHGIHGNISQN